MLARRSDLVYACTLWSTFLPGRVFPLLGLEINKPQVQPGYKDRVDEKLSRSSECHVSSNTGADRYSLLVKLTLSNTKRKPMLPAIRLP